MDVIRRHSDPQLRRPLAIIAFGGWNDACDVASTAAEFIIDAHDDTDVFAEIEPDPFYDFQQQRPTIDIKDGVARSLTWPHMRFVAIERPDDDRDLIVVTGPEPNFHWKTFSRSIVDVLAASGVEEAILIGAYIGPVSHTSSVTLSGVGMDTVSVIRAGLDSSSYSGPTGIVGVVQGACKEDGIRSLSMWAPTPPYLSGNPFPRAVLALVEKLSDITNLHMDSSELIAIDAEYTQRVDDALANADTDVAEYIEEIQNYDEPLLGPLGNRPTEVEVSPPPHLDPERTDALVEEIVRFLEGDD